ncbi:DUF6221 family protein [Kitasatospora sp. NPDC001540]|uniref:DUF6221 family protein n=1 Tax=Kitasatospora sp. NPDC001540 TaxID=3364014 RepID=UPI003677AC98
MNDDPVPFLRARLDEDVHNVVMITSLAPPGTDVILGSTIPMIDTVHAVADLYASVAHLDPSGAVPAGADFEAGRAAGLGEAVRLLAQIYDDAPGYREEWRPRPPAPGRGAVSGAAPRRGVSRWAGWWR